MKIQFKHIRKKQGKFKSLKQFIKIIPKFSSKYRNNVWMNEHVHGLSIFYTCFSFLCSSQYHKPYIDVSSLGKMPCHHEQNCRQKGNWVLDTQWDSHKRRKEDITRYNESKKYLFQTNKNVYAFLFPNLT